MVDEEAMLAIIALSYTHDDLVLVSRRKAVLDSLAEGVGQCLRLENISVIPRGEWRDVRYETRGTGVRSTRRRLGELLEAPL